MPLRYELGHHPDINVTLIYNAADGPKRTIRHKWRYGIVQGCCNREEEVAHETITRRKARGIKQCRYCARRGKPQNWRAKDPYPEYAEIVPPSWPVPGST